MSFGFSPSDVVALIALTTRVYKGWRDACADYADITGNLDILSRLLGRLEAYVPTKSEVDGSEEAEFARREALRRDLGAVVRESRRTVASLSDVLGQYRSLGTSKRSNWDRIRLGTKNIDSLRSRLSQHLSSIGAFLTVVQLQSIDRLNQSVAGLPDLMLQRLPLALGGFIDARVSDNLSVRGGSCLTAYTNDEKDVWREFRRECVKSGIKSEQIKQNRSELRRFFKDLVEDRPPNIEHRQGFVQGREKETEVSIEEGADKVLDHEPAAELTAELEHSGDHSRSSYNNDAEGSSTVVSVDQCEANAKSSDEYPIPRAALQAYVESDNESDVFEQPKAETANANANATDDRDSGAIESAIRNVSENPPGKVAPERDVRIGSEGPDANQSAEPSKTDDNTVFEPDDHAMTGGRSHKTHFTDSNGRLTASLNPDLDEVYPKLAGKKALRNEPLSSFRKSYNSGDIPVYPSDSEFDDTDLLNAKYNVKYTSRPPRKHDITWKHGSDISSEDNEEALSTSSEPELVNRTGAARRNLNDAASNMATIHSFRSDSEHDISEPSKSMNRGTNPRKRRSHRLFVSFIAERLGLGPKMPEWRKYDEHVSEIGLPSCFVCGCINGEEHESSALRDQFTMAVARFDFGSQTQRVTQKVLDSTKQQLIGAYTALLEMRLGAHHAYMQTLPCYQLYKRFHGNPPIHPSQLQILVTQIGHAVAIVRSGRDDDWRRVWSLYPLVLDHFLAIEYAAKVARRSAEHSNVLGSGDSSDYQFPRPNRIGSKNLYPRARAAENEISREATGTLSAQERAWKYIDDDLARFDPYPQERPPPVSDQPPLASQSSTHPHVECIMRKDGGPPIMLRRASGRPESLRYPRKSWSRKKGLNFEDELGDVSSTSRPALTLNATISPPVEKGSAFEIQRPTPIKPDLRNPPPTSLKRAETMPYPTASSRK